MPRWSETSTQPKPQGLWTPEEWARNIDVPRFGDRWIYCGTPALAEHVENKVYEIQIPGRANEELMKLANKISIYKGELNPKVDMVYMDDVPQFVDPKIKEGHLTYCQPLNIAPDTDFNYIDPEIESISMVPPYPNIHFDDTWECTEDSDGKRTYTKKKEQQI